MSAALGAVICAAAALAGAPDAPASTTSPDASVRHPGANGHLTMEQDALAVGAWRYFENNFQPATCLYNSVDGYPSTTMWDTASSIAGLVGAFEFYLIQPRVFDERMGCLLDALNRMPLFDDALPNKAYNAATLEMVDYGNNPGAIGASAIDLGRLLTWLAIVKDRYPRHADAIDRFVLRWNFCNVVDRGGTLFGAAVTPEGIAYRQEGRLGYEEYAANGFRLWGFSTEAASAAAPYEQTAIYRVPIAYDARDPVRYGAHNYVVSEAYLLAGIELNWDLPSDRNPNEMWQSDPNAASLAKRVYTVQERRWKATGILTARTEHQVAGAPFFVYDTIYSDGVDWNTLADDGTSWPQLAAVSTKAALGLAALFDTPYTARLAAAVAPALDPERGLYEGFYESNGERIDALTANTNGIVLETLLYQKQGKLFRPSAATSLWDTVPNAEFPGNNQCLPAPPLPR